MIVIFWAITVALGGFLFGFDTAVISGAEKSIQAYWGLTDYQHGLTMSIALIGTVFGALGGSVPADRLGRKNALALVAVLYLLSSVGTALAHNWYLFLLFRFAGGLGVGASSVIAPVYISEISPADKRGRLVVLFQFNIVLGILLAYFSNWLIGLGNPDSWRWMLGVQAFPSLLFLVLVRFVPETPRWLCLHRKDYVKAAAVLARINPATSEAVLRDIRAGAEVDPKVHAEKLWSRKYAYPISLAMLIAFFNQVSGINAIIYYAPRIFQMTGMAAGSSLLSSVWIGVVNFVFTLAAIPLIDKVGRRTLMWVGSVGLIISLSLVSASFYLGHLQGYSVTIYLLLFIACFAFSQGAVIWVFISEVFPNAVRAKGQTLGCGTHWVLASLIAFSFPSMAAYFGAGSTFLFFAVMMVAQLVFVWKYMPETKGTSLEHQVTH